VRMKVPRLPMQLLQNFSHASQYDKRQITLLTHFTAILLSTLPYSVLYSHKGASP